MKLTSILLGLLISGGSVLAQSTPRLDVLQALLATEQELAEDASLAYLQERADFADALLLAEEAAANLDAALALEESAPLAELERLRIDLEATAVAARYASDQVDDARERLFEGRRRVEALERQVRAILAGDGGDDPVTGRWAVRIASPVSTARFELQLNGTLVGGTFELDDGSTGSLRGTYAAGRLNLERVDVDGGIAGTYVGSLDEASGRASGLWSPAELTDGGPGVTGWSAERELPTEDEQDEEAAAAETLGEGSA